MIVKILCEETKIFNYYHVITIITNYRCISREINFEKFPARVLSLIISFAIRQ